MILVNAVVAALVLFYVGWFAAVAWRRGKASSRLQWIGAALGGVVAMIIARAWIDWALIPPWLWLLPVLIMAFGVAGVVRRWDETPWVRSDRPRRAIAGSAINGAVAVAVGVLVLA